MTYRAVLHGLLAICAVLALTNHAPARAQNEAAAVPSRQILVMLKLAPVHYRPNAGYGGSYGDTQAVAARRRIAQGIARRNKLELVDGWPMPLLGVDCYVMRLPDGLAVDDAVKQVSRDPMVAWSQPMQTYQTRGAVQKIDDPLFRAEPAASVWHLADLHRVATGRGVSVAIIDSKIDVTHPDLAGQFSTNQDFVSNRPVAAEQHGTGIAGVIGAKEDNGVGISGVAPDARMMALRACWQTGSGVGASTLCDSLSLARALQYAIEHDAKVINLSLSGPPDPLLAKLITLALSHKDAVVAAFDPNLPKGGFPASQPGVIAVTDELQSPPFGLYGAPGRDVPTTQPGGKWYLVNGSSYAAAHVSGLIALVRQERGPAVSLATALARSSRGMVDACATLLRTSASCDCSCALDRQLASDRRR